MRYKPEKLTVENMTKASNNGKKNERFIWGLLALNEQIEKTEEMRRHGIDFDEAILLSERKIQI